MRAKQPYIAVACLLLSCCHEKENKMCASPLVKEDKMLHEKLTLQLEKIDAEIAVQNWEEANQQLKQALAELGDRYVCDDTIDDSDMKLLAADLQEKEGKSNNAATVRRRILAERLDMLKRKIR